MTKGTWAQICAGSVGWNLITALHLLNHTAEPAVLMPFNVAFLVLTIVSLVMVVKVKA